ncbi:MAG: 4Fe-4S binding protein [Deltaproteobacteria bacterium]|nr:4Fe-4S binding protein [Deltaproteobacteria bacterium]
MKKAHRPKKDRAKRKPPARKRPDPFVRLAERLDDPRQVPSLPKILALMVTPREAELLLALPATLEQLLAWTDARRRELRATLRKACRSGLVLELCGPGGEPRYAFPDVYVDNILCDARNNRLGSRFRALWQSWTREHRARRRFDLGPDARPGFRVLPANLPRGKGRAVVPSVDARAIVRAARRRVLQQCACRFRSTTCEKPHDDICLVFDHLADEAVARGCGREVSVTEALDALERGTRAGLVHTSSADYLTPARSGTEFICSCCPCSCELLESYMASGRKLGFVTHYRAEVDAAKCTGCGNCLGRCGFGALSLREGALRIDDGLCVGCGLCLRACPTHALSLRFTPSAYEARRVNRHVINPRR